MESEILVIVPIGMIVNDTRDTLIAIRKYTPKNSKILFYIDGIAPPAWLLEKNYCDHLIIHENRRGYGYCLRKGFYYAFQHGYKYILTIDSDGEHDPRYIPVLLNEAITFKYDLVIGSRYHPLSPRLTEVRNPSIRINQIFGERLKKDFGVQIYDVFSGFRVYNSSVLRGIELTVDDYSLPVQIWPQILSRGCKIKEVPIPLYFRKKSRLYDQTPLELTIENFLQTYMYTLNRVLKKISMH